MTEIAVFKTEFVDRTKKILLNYEGEYKLSNVINCMLGLLILPYENVRNNPDTFWDTDLYVIPSFPVFRIHVFQPVHKVKRGGIIEYYPTTLRVFLQKVRNGLAHQHIQPVNTNGKFTGVVIRNYHNPDTQNILDMEVEFTRKQLEKFALFIADEYLKRP
jgi:hypothetical protein